MSPGIPEHVIDRIVREADFVALVNRYTRLEKKGGRYWGLCPFHKEDTPSFSVEPEEGLFYCFGCKEGGNIFNFLEMTEGLDFVQALEKLADEVGVDLDRYRSGGGGGGQRKKLREVNELAAAYYEKALEKSNEAEKARTYLQERGIGDEAVEKWRLGYAPDAWDYFLKFACKRDYNPRVLNKGGLVKQRRSGSGYIDRFRNRLMFPIRDRAGRVIAFGARALEEDQEPKYLNSPETPLFSKKKCFYGFSQARTPMRQSGTAVVVEGYTDVIMCHQHGFENVLAVLGTALTEQHAGSLSRLCDKVVLVFDPDEAGQRSAERSIEVLLAEGLDIEVAELPGDKDPFDLLTQDGTEAFEQVLEDGRDFVKFRIDSVSDEHDLDTMAGREAAFRDLAEMAVHVQDGPRRDLLVRRLAHELGVSEVSAWRHVRRQKRRSRGRGSGGEEGGTEPRSPSSRWALDVTGFLLVHPELLDRAGQEIDTDILDDTQEVGLLDRLLERHAQDEDVSAGSFTASLQDTDLSSLASSAVMAERKKDEISERTPEERFKKYTEFLAEIDEKEDLSELSPAQGSRGKDEDDELLRAYEQKLKQRDEKQKGRIG